MNYKKLTNEQINTFPYPNLIAELIESGYSICTLGEHMGLEGRRSENDPQIWSKLRGQDEIMASEAFGLARLFNTECEYLFSSELTEIDGMSAAYWRWFYENVRMKKRT